MKKSTLSKRRIAMIFTLTAIILIRAPLLTLNGDISLEQQKLIEENEDIDRKYAERDPIRINDDEEFNREAERRNWPGEGTEDDPYIVSGYSIDGSNRGFCFYVGNTTVYFELKNNHFHNADGGVGDYYFQNRGIFLNNVENAVIKNNLISDNEENGIDLYGSRENTIKNNTITNNSWDAIYVYYSPMNQFLNNNLSDNYWSGIRILESNANKVRGNSVTRNLRRGVSIERGNQNIVEQNNLSYNDQWGLSIYRGSQNHIRDNRISKNEQTGAHLENTDGNILYKNKFIENENQTYDDGNNDWDAGNPELGGEGGNYWSDYEGENRGDNIGDEIYEIEGDTNQDNYPWTNINMVPPVESFEISIDNIIASNRPILRIEEGYNVHENTLEGTYEGEIVINESIIRDDFEFTEGFTQYRLNEINLVREYEISVTINETTDTDSFQVEPLHVNGSSEMTQMAEKEDWKGTGNQDDPFVIEGYHIENSRVDYSVYFNNITSHFVFKDNLINTYNSDEVESVSDTGIHLNNVENAKIYENVISNHDLGLNLTQSSGNDITENEIKNNVRDGGLSLYESNSNKIRDNIISNNEAWGIRLVNSAENSIYRNVFIENENQAYDDLDNHWNDEDPRDEGIGGNYWSNYEGKNRGDGIGQKPYNISGGLNRDDYPWITSKRGKISLDAEIDTVRAGEKPILNITDSLDQYENELEGEYEVEIVVKNRTMRKNVTFAEGEVEFTIDQKTRANLYHADIIIYDVIKTSETVTFQVKPNTVDTIELTPDEDHVITAGNYLDFSAEAFDQYGNSITDSDSDFTWNNTDVNGVFIITTSGDYEVTVEYDGISEKVTVTVEPSDPYLLEIIPSDRVVEEGEKVNFTAIIYDQYNNQIRDVTNETEWSITDGAGGEWDENEYTSEKIGNWIVTGEYDGLESNITLRVEEDVLTNYLILAVLFLTITSAILIVNKYL